ncbi:MAG: glycosyltransferase family 2 protein [bacterium]
MYMESKNTPLVSVVTPVYNRGQFVQRALFSALRQEYQNMEFIVVDDGSTDDTKQIILSIQDQDKRVILIENTKNQ